MAIFYEVLVTYDIEDNKNRKKLFDKLKDMGLNSIQKSVFCPFYLSYHHLIGKI